MIACAAALAVDDVDTAAIDDAAAAAVATGRDRCSQVESEGARARQRHMGAHRQSRPELLCARPKGEGERERRGGRSDREIETERARERDMGKEAGRGGEGASAAVCCCVVVLRVFGDGEACRLSRCFIRVVARFDAYV